MLYSLNTFSIAGKLLPCGRGEMIEGWGSDGTMAMLKELLVPAGTCYLGNCSLVSYSILHLSPYLLGILVVLTSYRLDRGGNSLVADDITPVSGLWFMLIVILMELICRCSRRC
ncbi:hypothetical protein AAHA92_23021 [Salvia divinorum]|uniref:Uncharacterized protein n=1 Tax=Salvia divinorum TaxID=28513 RepID=A0ABD1GQL3_SALDI